MPIIKALSGKTRTECELMCLAGARAVSMYYSTILARVLDRFPMLLRTDDDEITPHLAMSGIWEPWVSIGISKLVLPGFCCLDVGANVGYYTLLMSDLASPFGSIHCYEPERISFDILERNVKINGVSATCYNYALGSHEAIGYLSSKEHQPSSSKFLEVARQIDSFKPIQCHRLDDVFPLGQRVDFIKLDCEGMEFDAIMGASRLIGKQEHLIAVVEFNHDLFESKYASCGGMNEIRSWCDEHFRTIGIINYDGMVSAIGWDTILKEPNRTWHIVLAK